MHIRKILSTGLLVILVLVIIYLIHGIMKPEVLPAGAVIESIKISNSDTYQLIKDKSTIIYLLSMNCGHCQYQVESLIKSIQIFKNYDVLLLFVEHNELMSPFKKWPELKSLTKIKTYEISKQNSIVIFGQGGVPRFYLFDSDGKLMKKILGEVKTEYLINEFNSLFVRAQR